VALLRGGDEGPHEPQLRGHRRSLWRARKPVLNVSTYEEGKQDWREAGLPVETGAVTA
jgi:hypothetical protein